MSSYPEPIIKGTKLYMAGLWQSSNSDDILLMRIDLSSKTIEMAGKNELTFPTAFKRKYMRLDAFFLLDNDLGDAEIV